VAKGTGYKKLVKMESFFTQLNVPNTNLVDSVCLLGLSVASLRSKKYSELFLTGQTSAPAEIIFQLPPESKKLAENHIEVTEN
jgi:hypothetical protein